jgi:polyisoprenoid-binding protein YceI
MTSGLRQGSGLSLRQGSGLGLQLASGLIVGLVLAASATFAAQAPTPAPLGPNEWRVDSGHSSAGFSVRHMMVSTVRGQLGPVAGTVEYDGKDVRTIKADVTIDLKSINTQNANRDNDLRGGEFFDIARFPAATFKSKRVEPGASGAFKLVGDLTIRGTTKEVTLDAEAPAPVTKGMKGVVTGTSATTRIKRQDYGLTYNAMVEAGPVVGDDVTVTIDLEIGRPTPPGAAK